MKKKKILVLFTAVLVLIFSFSSLVYAAEKEVRIGYITRLSVPWWIVCEDGLEMLPLISVLRQSFTIRHN